MQDVKIISEQREAALKLLKEDSSFRAQKLQKQIELIEPSKATPRDLARLQALCRKVATYNKVDLHVLATSR